MKNLNTFLLLLFFIFSLTSCQMVKKETNNEAHIDNDELTANNDGATIKHYLLPSPAEMLEYVESNNLKFKANIVNPIKNCDHYNLSNKQSLNLGIYTADLAYLSLFNKFNIALEYIQVIENLQKAIKIESEIKTNFINKKDKRYASLDSLYKIGNEIFSNFSQKLKQENRDETLALIFVGLYIEALYISINVIDHLDESVNIVDALDLHRFVFQNLMYFVEASNTNSIIDEEYEYLKSINEIFNKFVTEDKNIIITTDKDGLVIDSQNKIFISDTVYNELREKVNIFRDEITGI